MTRADLERLASDTPCSDARKGALVWAAGRIEFLQELLARIDGRIERLHATLHAEQDAMAMEARRMAELEAVIGKQSAWRDHIHPHTQPGTRSDYFLAVGIDSDVPRVLIYQHEEGTWTSGGGDTQRVRFWAHIPPLTKVGAQ